MPICHPLWPVLWICLFFSCDSLLMFSDWQAERVHELNEEIGKLLARAEQLGGEGNVDESQQVLEKVEKTRALKKEAEVSVGSKVMVEISLWF